MLKNEDNEKKKSSKAKKPPVNLNKYQNARIIQKYLVYVIGLSNELANKEVNKYLFSVAYEV